MQTTFRREIHELHAEICQALSDPTRIFILYELHEAPRNVGELGEALDLPQSTISRHLKVLRDRHLEISFERVGESGRRILPSSDASTALDCGVKVP